MAMTVVLRLSDEDRKRLDAPAELFVDPTVVTAREAMAIQNAPLRPGGPGGTMRGYDEPNEWRRALRGVDVIGEDGQTVMVDETDADGTVKQVPKKKADFGAMLVLVWLGLRRADVHVPLADLDVNFEALAMEFRRDDLPEPEGETPVGKGDGSPNSGEST